MRFLKHSLAAAASVAAILAAPDARADGGKFALAMMHFNVQYVAGGMVGYYSVPNPGVDLSAEQIEDLIVTESFAPVLELFDKHPTWSTDVELQGYMLDVMAERHPAVLDLLKKLATSGRIDVASFHYSDQLFIAYPASDWEWSQRRTKETFDKYGIPLGKSIFCQEGQSGAAFAPAMKERGYETFVWPKNLWIYQHGDFAPQPLYEFGDISLVVGGLGVNYQSGNTDIQVAWTFLDDGELLATGGLNPYFPDLFHVKPQAVADYEANLTNLEAQGFAIATVRQYVAAVKGLVAPAEPPVLLDGTWQPGSTEAVLRWLGGGGLWTVDERDNHVRSLGAMAHREIVAAETIASEAGIDVAALDDARRLLALGQVSDATGINPFRGEVEYGIAHFTEALRIARDVIDEAKEKLALGTARIDPLAGTVEEGTAYDLRGDPEDAPVKLAIEGGGRKVTERWEKVRAGLHRVEITFEPGDSRLVTVTWSGAGDDFMTTRALDDTTPVTFARSDFAFDSFYLALPIGVIGIGDGKFVIKDQAYCHLAAQIFRDKGDVVFADHTAPLAETQTWVFYYYDGTPAEAVDLARSINDRRTVAR